MELQEYFTVSCKQATETTNDYWKERGIIKWVKSGDECTYVIHANATIKYRNSTITSIVDDQDNVLQEHEQKVDILWKAYKEWFGQIRIYMYAF